MKDRLALPRPVTATFHWQRSKYAWLAAIGSSTDLSGMGRTVWFWSKTPQAVDAGALRSDMEAIAGDMWTAIDVVHADGQGE